MVAHVLILPHLKKFALYSEDYPVDDIVDLTNISPITITLGALLQGKAEGSRRNAKLSPRYSEQLAFRVNTRREESTRRYFMNNDNVRLFSAFLKAQFKLSLLTNVKLNRLIHGMNTADAIRRYMDDLDINEDDISYEALKKAVWRHEQKKKKRLAETERFALAS